ncbi:MAG TPA: hypothetical protein VN814_08575 [Caulobacteraceae bacterium]|nr:hypothetical protein [Caulobacteraceae bacterium]
MTRGAVLAMTLAFIAATAAQAATPSPTQIVRGIYQRLVTANATGKGYEPSDDAILSPRLLALEAAARKAAGTDVPCGLDFSIWFDGQEYDLQRADVTVAPGATADAQEVVAKFDSLGAAHELHFTFRYIAGRWRLDEAQSVIGTKWVWSRLLQCKD